MTDNNKHIQSFKNTYDHLFAEFHAKLNEEYAKIKQEYVLEYQANYQMNLNEKQANIDQMVESIQEKKRTLVELGEQKLQNISCLERFFKISENRYYYVLAMKHLKAYYRKKKEKKRIQAYTRNSIYRKNLLKIFRAWRKVAHEDGKIRIDQFEKTYRLELER